MDAWSGALSLRLLGRRVPGLARAPRSRYIQCGRLQSARQRGTRAHTHLHTHPHAHTTHAQAPGTLSRCLPQPQGSGSSACLRPSAAYGDTGPCSPPAPEWGTVCSWVLKSLRATIPQTLPNLPPVLDHHPSPWVCERGAGTRAAPGLRRQPQGGVLRVTHRDVFRS